MAGQNGQSIWYVAAATEGAAPAGPYTMPELQARLQRGELTSEARVWCEGMESWEPLGTIQRLSGDFQQKSPQSGMVTALTTGVAVAVLLLVFAAAGIFFLARHVSVPKLITSTPVNRSLAPGPAPTATPAPTPAPTPTPVPTPAFEKGDGLRQFLAQPDAAPDPALRDLLHKLIDAETQVTDLRAKIQSLKAEMTAHETQASFFREEADRLAKEPGRSAERQKALTSASSEQRDAARTRNDLSRATGQADTILITWCEAAMGIAARARGLGYDQLARDAAQSVIDRPMTPTSYKLQAESFLKQAAGTP